jgi:hypothetical protein
MCQNTSADSFSIDSRANPMAMMKLYAKQFSSRSPIGHKAHTESLEPKHQINDIPLKPKRNRLTQPVMRLAFPNRKTRIRQPRQGPDRASVRIQNTSRQNCCESSKTQQQFQCRRPWNTVEPLPESRKRETQTLHCKELLIGLIVAILAADKSSDVRPQAARMKYGWPLKLRLKLCLSRQFYAMIRITSAISPRVPEIRHG